MGETPVVDQRRGEGRLFRYGMLLFITALWCAAWWMWATRRPQDRSGPVMNVVVTSMLLVNHIIGSFVPVESRRRVRPVQIIFVGACTLFVFRKAFFN